MVTAAPVPAPVPSPRVDDVTVLHVDMDAFYASVSLLDHPELRGLPVVVGGGWRSVVLSATYEARAFGVRSGMPMATARRLCPQAVVVRPDHDRYARVSEAVMAIFAEVTPRMEPVSMEEAFLDVSATGRQWGGPAAVGQWIRDTVADEQQITCSVGGAPTKAVAKMASRAAKPDGMRLVGRAEVVPFLHPMPVGALWGVGEATEGELHRLGLRTVGQLAHVPAATLRRAFGEQGAARLHALAWGRDDDQVTPARVERSVGSSQTFSSDVDDPDVIRRRLLHLAERTASRMRHGGVMGRTVVLTVRFSDFTTITRSRTVAVPTDVTREVHATACALYEALGLQRARIRMLGVRVEGITTADETLVQGRLDEPEHGWREAERAMDRAAARFGSDAVRPASLLERRRGTPATAQGVTVIS
ncbi:DNA polymerase IV [Ornithinimicrobium pekingense]|uniref:DNA polymerase IV n=1 Tax=Ornithinimicrobium pekingense TaxID=384677 RepID=A0ABQ2F7Q4_9MICO|nr:DNA polymerase IV [Ornithinimicrobium pekingense]GGK69543.1 DNA polymerase IV [Ornithinimicrobium pekingense]